MKYQRTSDADSEPITLTEAKAHLRVEHDSENSLIESLIKSARYWCEGFTRRSFVSQTWVLKLDDFPSNEGNIYLPSPPLLSIINFTYIDENGDSNSLDLDTDYNVDTVSDPGLIYLPYEVDWPTARDQQNAITITFLAGYGDTANTIPDAIKQAILLLVGHWYEHREDVVIGSIANPIPMGAEMLLWNFRDYRF